MSLSLSVHRRGLLASAGGCVMMMRTRARQSKRRVVAALPEARSASSLSMLQGCTERQAAAWCSLDAAVAALPFYRQIG